MIQGFRRGKGLYNLDRARSTRGEWGVEEPTPVHGHLVQKATAGWGTTSSSFS